MEGQIQGAVAQAIGYALIEELVWHDGRLANPSFMDYKIPGTSDVPYEIHAIILENAEPTHPFGAKGIGEPPIVGIAPAVGRHPEINVRGGDEELALAGADESGSASIEFVDTALSAQRTHRYRMHHRRA